MLIKLLITAVAGVLLLLHLQPVTWMPDFVATTDIGPGEMTGIGVQLLADTSCSSPQYCRSTSRRDSRATGRHGPSGNQKSDPRQVSGAGSESYSRQVSNDRPL